MRLRIRFEKIGAVRYIGHLDVLRFFQKVMRRADIDIKYTTGFSPHQVMSFAQPLSVGLESAGEYMDIEVNSYEGEAEFLRKVNEASVPGISCTSVRILPDDAENAMASVKAAEYRVFIKRDKTDDNFLSVWDKDGVKSLSDRILEFMSRENVLIEKEGKNGIRQVDIKPGIFVFEAIECEKTDNSEIGFHMFLDSSSGGNVKPIQVLSEFYKDVTNKELPENALRIKRIDMYTLKDDIRNTDDNLNISADSFISLGEIGYKTMEDYMTK